MELGIFDYIALFVSALLFVLIALLQIRARQKKADIQSMLFALLCFAIGNTILNIFYDNNYIILSGYIIFPLGFLPLFLHYESITSEKPKSIFFFGLCLIYVIGILASTMFFWMNENYPSMIRIYTNSTPFNIDTAILFFIYWIAQEFDIVLGIVVFYRAILIMIRINRLAHLNATRNEIIALVCLLLNRVFQIRSIYIPNDVYLIFAYLSIIFSIIGLIVIMTTYIRNPDYIYLLPFPIYSFMVYNRDGLLCYSRKVQQQKLGMEEKDILISGAFTAIGSLIAETLGKQARIHHINAQQFQIFFKTLPSDRGTFVVIAYGNTALFEKSLTRFTELLTPSIFDLLNAAGIETTQLEREIDVLMKQAFPYVIMENTPQN